MPDLTSFLPVRAETVATVRFRMDADVNAGLLPADPAYRDITPGGLLDILLAASALELAREWDFLGVEVPSAAFPTFAYGEFLDLHGISLNVERNDEAKATGTVTFTGTAGTLIASATQVATVQTDPDADPIVFQTTAGATIGGGGTVDVAVEALVAGDSGNVQAGAVVELLSGVSGVTGVANAAAVTGGEDVETDESYLERILLELISPHGAGTVPDYERWALDYPGVGYVTVEPLWNGSGTVRVVISDEHNDPSSGTVVSGLQALLDPVPGGGHGLAPIGATVTVATVTGLTVTVVMTLVLDIGHSLDGDAGTVAVRSDVLDALIGYIDQLPPGEDVVRNRVIEFVMSVPGVRDITALSLNGGPGNVPVAPLRVAQTAVPVVLSV